MLITEDGLSREDWAVNKGIQLITKTIRAKSIRYRRGVHVRLCERKHALQVKVDDFFKGGIGKLVKGLSPICTSVVDQNVQIWMQSFSKIETSVNANKHTGLTLGYFGSKTVDFIKLLKISRDRYALAGACSRQRLCKFLTGVGGSTGDVYFGTGRDVALKMQCSVRKVADLAERKIGRYFTVAIISPMPREPPVTRTIYYE